jgi:hypothetical protein
MTRARGDTGLLHTLLGINSQRDLENHPKVGASWEGYAIEEVLKALRPDEAYYWATHQGAEIDLVLFKSGGRIGVECKRADAPRLTPSMRIALADLKLDRIHVVYSGEETYSLARTSRSFHSPSSLKKSRDSPGFTWTSFRATAGRDGAWRQLSFLLPVFLGLSLLEVKPGFAGIASDSCGISIGTSSRVEQCRHLEGIIWGRWMLPGQTVLAPGLIL